jgi:hypothetical protein
MRLLGALAPKTLAGTIQGAAADTAAVADVWSQRRRLMGSEVTVNPDGMA